MTLSLSSVKYVGPAMQARLESNGINTLEQLVALSEQALAAIPGIGANTARGILDSAQALMEQPAAAVEQATVETNSTDRTANDNEASTEAEQTEGSIESTMEVTPTTAPLAAKRPSRARKNIVRQPTTEVLAVPVANSVAKRTRAKTVSATAKPTAAVKPVDLPKLEADQPTEQAKVNRKKVKKPTKNQESSKKQVKEEREAEKQLKKAKKVIEKERKKAEKSLKKMAKQEKKDKKAADKAAKKIVKKAKKAAKAAGAKI